MKIASSIVSDNMIA